MRRGYLSQYFDAVAAKQLSAVEADLVRSNQHELNGNSELRRFFGPLSGSEKKKFAARFVYLTDSEDEPVVDETDGCFLTWYDARAKSSERTHRSEYRLYFPTSNVSLCAAEGDLLILGRLSSGLVLVLIAEKDSTIASQVRWLFGLEDLNRPEFAIREQFDEERDRIGFASRVVLEQIGIEVVDEQARDFSLAISRRFGGVFPSTLVLSEYARSTMPDVVPADDPDAALMAWLEQEEILFRAIEKEIVSGRLRKGFKDDVDGFVQYSLSVLNRRKSRAGFALENHLSCIFDACAVRYSRSEFTEQKSKPDFVFPGILEYRDASFSSDRLTMLAAKTSCKDRWRQVLSEAARIKNKHLLTLEAAISEPQTDEMKLRGLQLVVPAALHSTYSDKQAPWLMSLRDLVGLIKIRQH